MRRKLIAVLAGMMLLAPVLAMAKKKPETIEELKARAEAAEKRKQMDLYAELAQRQLEAADAAYATSVEKAKQLFLDAAQSAESAAQAALDSNHRLKRTEIKLRELSHHMADLRRTWAFEDRGPVDPAIQRVEMARNKLLDRMFKK